MATREFHVIMGQSNAVGSASKSDLTDTRYDISDSNVQQWTRLNGTSSGAWSTVTIGANQFSVEAPIGHRRRALGNLPLMFRAASSGTDLAVSWRSRVSSSLYHDSFLELWDAYDDARRTTFSGDTIEIASFTWVQGETDTFSSSSSAAYEDNLANLVEDVRFELGTVPFFIVQLHPTFTGTGPSPQGQIDQVRNAQAAVAAATARCYAISTDQPNISLQSDGAHYTSDSYMALGDDIADQMASDGLSVTQLVPQARVFSVESTAQTFADSLQAGEGARDENPSSGGYGVRLGAGARDPWPTTLRSELEKHRYRDEWAVPLGGVTDGVTYDLETGRRPLDLSFWEGQ